jgi:hypothetical protein
MNDEFSAQESKDGHEGAQETADETTASLADETGGAVDNGALPTTPINQANPVLSAEDIAAEARRLHQHDKDVLHDKICENVLMHLAGFMQVTQGADLDVACYGALRGQTNDQLQALDTLLQHAGALRGNMDQLNAERVAMNSDFVTMAQNLSEVGENIQQVFAERDNLLKEADSLRAAAVRAEDARTALAAAHAAQQPSATSRLAPRFPPMPAGPYGQGAQTPRQPAFVPFGGTFTPGSAGSATSTMTMHSPAAVMIQGHTKNLQAPIMPQAVKLFVAFGRMELADGRPLRREQLINLAARMQISIRFRTLSAFCGFDPQFPLGATTPADRLILDSYVIDPSLWWFRWDDMTFLDKLAIAFPMDGANGARIGATLEELCKKIHLTFDIRNTEGARDYIGRVLIAQASAQPAASMGGSEVACIRLLLKHVHTKDDNNVGVRTMKDKLTKRFVAEGYPTSIALFLVAVDSEYQAAVTAHTVITNYGAVRIGKRAFPWDAPAGDQSGGRGRGRDARGGGRVQAGPGRIQDGGHGRGRH